MKSFALIIAMSGMIAFCSCKKETISCEPQTPSTEIKDQSKSFLKDAKSDAPSEFYISGEFDGYKIYCASTHGQMYQYQDTGFNALYLDESIGLDNIHLIRENDDRTIMLAFYFDKAKIFTRQFPYIIPRENLDLCESVEMELINMKKLGTAGQHSPNDDFSFWSTTNKSIRIQVNNFIDNVMEGTFDGALLTETGAEIIVKNGKFRIKLVMVKQVTNNI